MSYNWDLMRKLLREAQQSAYRHFTPRQYAEQFAMELEDAGQPLPDLDALRGEAAAYEGHLVNGEFMVPRPEDEGGTAENYMLTPRGERLLQLLEDRDERIRRALDEKGTAAMTPEVFDDLELTLP